MREAMKNMRKAGLLMRIGLGLCIAAFFLGSCHAQAVKTIVSGTIIDPNGVPYAGGTIDATLVPTGTTPTVAGVGQIDGYVQPVSIATDGTFSLPLYCNAAGGGCTPISPASTQWRFTVRNPGAPPPVGFGGLSFTITATITGATQSLTTPLQAAAPQLLVSTGGSLPATVVTSAGLLPNGNFVIGHNNTRAVEDSGVALSILSTLAPLLNPSFVGVPTAPTAAPGTSTTQIATMAALQAAVTGTVKTLSTNITPVTVTGPGTGLQNLMSATAITAGTENTLGKTFAFHTGGTTITAAGSIEFTFNIGTGSGNPAISGFTPASPGTSYNWTIDGTCTTTTTGATGQMLCVGKIAFGGAAGNVSQDSSVSPFNFTFTGANLTGALTPQMQALFSSANGGNTATENLLSVTQLN